MQGFVSWAQVLPQLLLMLNFSGDHAMNQLMCFCALL